MYPFLPNLVYIFMYFTVSNNRLFTFLKQDNQNYLNVNFRKTLLQCNKNSLRMCKPTTNAPRIVLKTKGVGLNPYGIFDTVIV